MIFSMRKRCYISMVFFFSAMAGILQAQDEAAFSFDTVRQKAQILASKEYKPMDKELPRALRHLNYDELRTIHFDEKASIWRMEKLPFQLQFMPRGGMRNEKISVNWVEGARVEAIPFSRDMFNYEDLDVKERRIDDDLGFNGFRINYPLNTIERLDELVVFQGASYFRALAKDLTYGLSARGLAIDCGEDTPEEFPEFVEFWVEKPDRDARQIKLYALLDSPSLAGAYEMVIHPGKETVMDIHATLYARKLVEHLGIAPLTSMFWFGENSFFRFGDFRPEVHDSDGLLEQTGSGEWYWRPLSNEGPQIIAIDADTNPKGFGLLQRDRDYSHYQDLVTLYHKHPGAWVEPQGDWGEGSIRLLELPTDNEFNDNIVAFWEPATNLTPDHPLDVAYRLHWIAGNPENMSLSTVLRTRIGQIGNATPSARRFVLEFSEAATLDRGHPEKIDARVVIANGTLQHKNVIFNTLNNSWRVVLDVKPKTAGQSVEIRCTLTSDENPGSETWIYSWTP